MKGKARITAEGRKKLAEMGPQEREEERIRRGEQVPNELGTDAHYSWQQQGDPALPAAKFIRLKGDPVPPIEGDPARTLGIHRSGDGRASDLPTTGNALPGAAMIPGFEWGQGMTGIWHIVVVAAKPKAEEIGRGRSLGPNRTGRRTGCGYVMSRARAIVFRPPTRWDGFEDKTGTCCVHCARIAKAKLFAELATPRCVS